MGCEAGKGFRSATGREKSTGALGAVLFAADSILLILSLMLPLGMGKSGGVSSTGVAKTVLGGMVRTVVGLGRTTGSLRTGAGC